MEQSSLENQSNPSEENVLSILVATDTHIGYAERDPLRQNDSFDTFEEILQIAQQYQVDMILLGGDLFHDNKPSRRAIHDTIYLMRKYCLGERECQLDLVSDPLVNFGHCQFKHANYHDPNLNVAYPIFSIHGNHDDPTGEHHLSAIDILSTSGLLNHFGKSKNCDDIEISPVLLKKGTTKLALFGLGAMRDERLHRTFIQKKVKMLRPLEDENSWFNMFVIHQNRSKHGEKNHIPENFLDGFLDLVIWGHEHECLIEPTWSSSAKNFYVSQPGSSVATSLSEGESKQKYVGVLQIYNKSFKMEKVPLKTVRQFLMDDIVLGETSIKPHEDEQVLSYLADTVESMIKEAEETHTKHPKQPTLPLIRIKVEYSGGYNIINPHRFGQQFVGKVANNKDILLFYRKKSNLNKERNEKNSKPDVDINFSQASSIKMEDLINEYLNAVDEKLQLDILSERKLSKALNEFILKDEKSAIELLVKDQLNKAQKKLVSRNIKEESILFEISRLKVDDKVVDEKTEDDEINELLARSRNQVPNNNDNVEDSFESDDDGNEPEVRPLRGRGSRGGRGSRASKSRVSTQGKSRGRGVSSQVQLTMQESFTSTARRFNNNNGTNFTGDYSDVMDSLKSFDKGKSSCVTAETISSDEDSDPFSVQPSKRKRH